MPAAREGTRSAAKAFDRWFGTPKLVRETSRKPLVGRGAAPVEKTVEEVKRDFSDIVLQPGLQVGWGVGGAAVGGRAGEDSVHHRGGCSGSGGGVPVLWCRRPRLLHASNIVPPSLHPNPLAHPPAAAGSTAPTHPNRTTSARWQR